MLVHPTICNVGWCENNRVHLSTKPWQSDPPTAAQERAPPYIPTARSRSVQLHQSVKYYTWVETHKQNLGKKNEIPEQKTN